ncbi:hypothetical protein [Spirosoma jeollabukense]
MKTILMATCLLLTIGFVQKSWAQSTTGGRSGGSTASTGTGYLTPGKRPATTNAASMTIADEGASRAYMYVPPTNSTNRAASPDGSAPSSMKKATGASSGKSSEKRKQNPHQR